MAKKGHFSGDFQYEIAKNFQKSMEKGVRRGHFDRFLMILTILACQYPDISHLLAPSYGFMLVLLVAGKGSKSQLNTFKN